MIHASYKLDKVTITNDLSKEKPQWILSAYGPSREAPRQVFGGFPREQSFEELRYCHYHLAAQGRPEQAIQEAQALVSNAEEQIQTVLNDVDGAIKYVVNGQNEHPNRIDIVKAKELAFAQEVRPGPNHNPTTTFGSGSTAVSAFGQPSMSIPNPSPLSSFGKPSTLAQAATLGRPTTSFGQPASTPGNPAAPISSPFGVTQQSQFGQSSGVSSTIQPLLTATQPNNPFGQSSGFGQPSSLGQSSTPSASNVFGRPAAPISTNLPNNLNTLGPPPRSSSQGIFGQPANGAPTPIGPSSKSQPSFANRAVPTFGFSLESFISSHGSFDKANIHTDQPLNAGPLNDSTVRRTDTSPSGGIQAGDNPPGRISNWKGNPVSYIDDEPCFKNQGGAWQRIWFPHGPPVFRKTLGPPEEAYNMPIQEKYMFAKEHGVFKNGMLPEVPPKREWCNWDF